MTRGIRLMNRKYLLLFIVPLLSGVPGCGSKPEETESRKVESSKSAVIHKTSEPLPPARRIASH